MSLIQTNTAARSSSTIIRIGRRLVRLFWQHSSNNDSYSAVLCIVFLLAAGVLAKIAVPIHP
jgi:hypothetical protein